MGRRVGDEFGAMSVAHSTPRLLELWSKPTAEYRGKPFWSWNGKLERDELLRQVGVLEEMGFGGFFMHSRTGLVTEYLGDEWFELVNACADEAERRGMEAWLYDEDRWPSGSAGGIATRDPRYRMRYLRLERIASEDFRWRSEFVAAFLGEMDAYHGEGFHFHEGRRIFQADAGGLEAGKQVVAFAVEVMDEDSFYNGASYLNTLDPAATRKFLEVTHERYREKCGGRLGRSIKGMFTDEPHRGMVLSSFADHHHSSWVIPWTENLAGEFERQFGYDLVARLPEIFLKPFGSPVSQVKWHYMELLQRMFLENFMAPMREWCRAHDLVLTGHALHEDSLVCQAVPNGSMIRTYEHFEWPGIDVLTEDNRKFWLAKQCQSAARQLDRDWVLSELYGCTGWQLTFQGHKAVGDWQALMGVNVRCPHLSWYSMAGESKRDYPGSILHQSAWYPHYGRVEDYFSRIHVVLQMGAPVCELLVVSPVESVWAQIHHGWVNNLTASTAPIQELERQYEDVFHWLAGAQMDFDYGDEDFLERMGRVEMEGGSPVLVVGKGRYRAVLVAGLATVRAATLDLLEEFVAAGGAVIVSGDAPEYVDAVPSDRGRAFYEARGPVPFYQNSLTRACRGKVATFAEAIDCEHGYRIPTIYAHARETDQGRFVMLLRVERVGTKRDVLVRLRGAGIVEEWNARTGERRRVAADQVGDWLELRADFGPSQEHLYRIGGEDDGGVAAALAVETAGGGETVRAIEGAFAYRLAEPNVCVLDRAAHRTDGGEWRGAAEILKVDRAIRKSVGARPRGGRMPQPWFSRDEARPILARVGLRFEFEIEVLPPGGVVLVLEAPGQHAAIRVNGECLDAASTDGWWIDKCLERLLVPAGCLREGVNRIELEVDFHVGTDLEAVYLVGDFGVRLDGLRQIVTRLPEKLAAGCVTTQGLPFYGGKIVYEIPNDALAGAAGRARLRLPECEAACVTVSRGGREVELIAFEPRETEIAELLDGEGPLELGVILTRRNTFGPLHQLPRHVDWYGPENWVSEGASFSEAWVLWPAGLLGAPEISFEPEAS